MSDTKVDVDFFVTDDDFMDDHPKFTVKLDFGSDGYEIQDEVLEIIRKSTIEPKVDGNDFSDITHVRCEWEDVYGEDALDDDEFREMYIELTGWIEFGHWYVETSYESGYGEAFIIENGKITNYDDYVEPKNKH